MHPIVRNILALVAGFIVGSLVNMGVIMISESIIPHPPGTDISTPEGLKAALPLFEPRHFLFPFLAHALGTLAGAFTAGRLAAGKPMRLALIIGALFLAGGLVMNFIMLSSPLWFAALDLVFAYLPMGYLGGRWAQRARSA